MDPTQLEDEHAPKQVRFGGRRRKAGPVFRVIGNQSKRFGLGGLALGSAVCGFVLAKVGTEELGLGAIGGGAVFALVGFLIGKSRRDDTCSECDRFLPLGALHCGGCDGRIVGEIKNRQDRLTATPTVPTSEEDDEDDDDDDDE